MGKNFKCENFNNLWISEFFTGKTSPGGKIKNLQVRKRSDFGGFHSPEVRKIKYKNCQICILWFHCVAKNIEG
jgi:hypothetical protein